MMGMLMKTLDWEGVTWTLVDPAHTLGFPVDCDGCGHSINTGAKYDGNDGSSALWCAECVDTVKDEQRKVGPEINVKCRNCRLTGTRPFGSDHRKVCEDCRRCVGGHCDCGQPVNEPE